jgi:hypothetical protein
MPSARKASPTPQPRTPRGSSLDPPPQFVPRRRHPWLLTSCAALALAWLAFLAYLAARG